MTETTGRPTVTLVTETGDALVYWDEQLTGDPGYAVRYRDRSGNERHQPIDAADLPYATALVVRHLREEGMGLLATA